MPEMIGEKPLQYCWPGSSTWMVSSDLYEALKLALGSELVVLKDGVEVFRLTTESDMNDFERQVMGSENMKEDRNWYPHWRAQRAVMLGSEAKCRKMFPRCFAMTIMDLKMKGLYAQENNPTPIG